MTTKNTANIGEHQTVPLLSLNHYSKNPRRGDVQAIKGSIVANGIFRPVIVNKGTYTEKPNEILAGNHTVKAIRELAEENPDDRRWQQVEVWMVDVDAERAARIVLADNRTADLGSYDNEELLGLLDMMDGDLDGTGYDADDLELIEQSLADLEASEDELSNDSSGDDYEPVAINHLADSFLMPPMTVLDTRRGDWRERKRQWLDLGIDSEVGREENLIYSSIYTKYQNWYTVANKARAKNPDITNEEIEREYQAELSLYRGGNGTSIFDPVLCELLYLWFSNPADTIIDPWAGGSVRGIVASYLNRNYVGHELRPEQCEANRSQYSKLTTYLDGKAQWVEGDSRETLPELQADSADMIIGCPPYFDLEEYSDLDEDLSNMSDEDFSDAMRDTLEKADRSLKNNRFAAFVVGSVRDKKRNLRDMKSLMVECAPDSWNLANDAVLVNQVGSAAIRARGFFEKGRALGRVHQDIVIFVKGDRAEAAKRLDPIDIRSFESEEETQDD